MMPGKTERRVVAALLVTSIVPLVAAIFVANSLFFSGAWLGFDPEFGKQLDRSVEIYKDYVKAIKDDMRHQTDAISADEVLREAASRRNTELIEVQLDT